MTRRTKAADETAAGWIEPCLAQAAAELPSGPLWVHEIKYDGYRVQAHVCAGKATLLTRKGLDWTNRLGLVVEELAALPVSSVIIDGEAIVQGRDGIADIHALQRELKLRRRARILLMAFDLLQLDGRDWRARPLIERKAELARVLGPRQPGSLLQLSEHIEGDGREVLRSACRMGLEGIVSKRVDRPYRSGRCGDWLKAKCAMADPFVVIGYVASRGPSETVGSLVLGYYENDALKYAGRVGTGFSAQQAAAIWQMLQSAHSEAPTLARRLTRDQRNDVVWVEPRLVAQVAYRGWTSDDIVRHAAFKAFRNDIEPTHVCRPASLR